MVLVGSLCVGVGSVALQLVGVSILHHSGHLVLYQQHPQPLCNITRQILGHQYVYTSTPLYATLLSILPYMERDTTASIFLKSCSLEFSQTAKSHLPPTYSPFFINCIKSSAALIVFINSFVIGSTSNHYKPWSSLNTFLKNTCKRLIKALFLSPF